MHDPSLSKDMKKIFNEVLTKVDGKSVTIRAIRERMKKQGYHKDDITFLVNHLKTSSFYKKDKRGNDYVLKGYMNNTGRTEVIVDNILPRGPKRGSKIKNNENVECVAIVHPIDNTNKNLSRSAPHLPRVSKEDGVQGVNIGGNLPGLEDLESKTSLSPEVGDVLDTPNNINREEELKAIAKKRAQEKIQRIRDNADTEAFARKLKGDHISYGESMD